MPENEAIKVHLGNMFIHYRYHPERKTHVHIADPPRSEVSAKYITTAQNCHLIKGRDITVHALLAYAVQKASTTATNLHNAIRDTPSEELVTQQSFKHSTFTELVKAILDRVNRVTNREENNPNVDREVDEINALIDIMRDKNVQPKCKRLHRHTIELDFTTVWKKWANYPALKMPKDPETSSEASYASMYGSTQATGTWNIHHYGGMDVPREILENILVFNGKPNELNQFLSTINSYATMYRVCRVDLVMLRSRGKAQNHQPCSG